MRLTILLLILLFSTLAFVNARYFEGKNIQVEWALQPQCGKVRYYLSGDNSTKCTSYGCANNMQAFGCALGQTSCGMYERVVAYFRYDGQNLVLTDIYNRFPDAYICAESGDEGARFYQMTPQSAFQNPNLCVFNDIDIGGKICLRSGLGCLQIDCKHKQYPYLSKGSGSTVTDLLDKRLNVCGTC